MLYIFTSEAETKSPQCWSHLRSLGHLQSCKQVRSQPWQRKTLLPQRVNLAATKASNFAPIGSCNLTLQLCSYPQKACARPRLVSPPLWRSVACQQTKVWLLYWGQMALFTCSLTSETRETAGLLFCGTLEDFSAPVQSERNNTAHFQRHQTASACLLDKYISTLDRRHLTRHSFQSRPHIMTFSCRRSKVCQGVKVLCGITWASTRLSLLSLLSFFVTCFWE